MMDAGIGTFTEMDFDDAVEATRRALTDRGFSILHEIDLAATLKNETGRDIERVLILGACKPGFVGQAFDINKDVALLMPSAVVVRESGGGSVVEAQNPALLPRVISGGLQDLADELSAEMRSMLNDLSH